uniref:Uncharacterized protein n=1 Tax=viral metagenome TaxID=1070528 RepID=A0A6C0E4C9_9ZZZZ
MYKKLLQEHEALKHEYSENTIIQSMNDMKEKYNDLIKNTVALYRYDALQERKKVLQNKLIATSVLIDYILLELRHFDNIFMNDGQVDVENLKMQLSVIKGMLQPHI